MNIDEILALNMPIDPNHQKDVAAIKQEVKQLFLEIIEEAWTEKQKAENRKNTYETGSRLAKRILKQKVTEHFEEQRKDI